MKSAAMRHFHLPLPEELYEKLREQARRQGRPATAVARRAIEAWLRQVRRMEISEAIASYAAEHAGTKADLDEPLESAGIDSWIHLEK
ncbi:MAG: ribbon-helix-helix protein, CopG family [Thermoanaerobaculia bacterium]